MMMRTMIITATQRHKHITAYVLCPHELVFLIKDIWLVLPVMLACRLPCVLNSSILLKMLDRLLTMMLLGRLLPSPSLYKAEMSLILLPLFSAGMFKRFEEGIWVSFELVSSAPSFNLKLAVTVECLSMPWVSVILSVMEINAVVNRIHNSWSFS